MTEADEGDSVGVDELRLDSVSAILNHRQTVTFLGAESLGTASGNESTSVSNCVVLEIEKDDDDDEAVTMPLAISSGGPLRRSLSVVNCAQFSALPVRSKSFPKL